MADVKYKEATSSPDPKVVAQAVATIVVFLAGYFGFDLDPELIGPLAVVIGFGLGYVIRPAQTVPDPPPGGTTVVPPPR